MDKLFYYIHQSISSHRIVCLMFFLLSLIGLGVLASKINFEEDITKLIPQTEKTSEAQNALKNANFADKIIVHLTLEKDGNIDDLTEYASQFIDSIKVSSAPFIKNIQGKVEDEDILNTLDFVYNNLPLFLEKSDYQLIKQKLSKDSINAITYTNYKTLISPSGFIAKDFILKDPLGLSFIALKKFKELNFGNDFSLHNGYILSKDKNHLLLFISPTYASSETDRNTELAKNLYTLESNLKESFKDKVSCDYFGGVLVAVANAGQIKQDIQITISIAISILILILILFYRKLSIPFILFVPTAFGGLVAISALFLLRTKISAISLGIGSVLLGVTLDYALHILTHIRSNHNIKALYREIAKPILMSSLTTALAFLCLLFLESQALQDLGIFAAISVLTSAVFSLVFIPLVYYSKNVSVKKNNIIDYIASFPLHKKKWAIIILAVVFGISAFTYKSVSFNKDLNALNFQSQNLVDAQKRLDVLTNLSSKSVYLVAHGNTTQEALEINDTIFSKLQRLKIKNEIIQFSSIASLINSENNQNQSINYWHRFWTPTRLNNTEQNFIESGKKLGFKPTTFNNFYTHLITKFKPLSISDYADLKIISTEDFLTVKDNFATVTTLVKVKDENLTSLINTFKDDKQTVIVDRKHINETFLGNLKSDFNRLVLYSSIVVFLLLLLFYRSLSLTLVTCIPIALTWFLTIGIMGLFAIEFNVFNIIISTFIFGLGIDYCIFITNGLLHEYRTGEKALATHKISILLSVVTTILGVGVLVFAKHPALHSISLVSIIGILSALAISFSLQPILFKLFIGSKTKGPIHLRLLLHSIISFGYYGIGGFVLSMISVTILKIIPVSKKKKMSWFHKVLSKFMKSVLYSNPFLHKKVINEYHETFKKQAVIISNHTSFLDILAIGMLHPKIVFLVNDWVYNSPVFGKAVQMAGFYPVSSGIENGLSHLQNKVNQGYSLMVFPEGTRAKTNKIKRFHKGAFYLAEQLNLDIVPVLIHGNSEVNPKGSFVIKNGSITLKVLERITVANDTYGINYKERTKKISAFFKQEFKVLRKNIEHETYFHNLILEDFRYKGNETYKKVKLDLKLNSSIYKTILDYTLNSNTILSISKDQGQLEFLLSLDNSTRKLITFLDDEKDRIILKNSFITNSRNNIRVIKNIDDSLEVMANVLIVSLNKVTQNQILGLVKNISTFILLKEGRNIFPEIFKENGFVSDYESDDLLIIKKI